jgi:hypothetical protein
LQINAETFTLNGSSLFSITGTSCSFTTPLAHNGTCTINISYATPAIAPIIPNLGAVAVTNDGSGTTNGNTTLALVGR